MSLRWKIALDTVGAGGGGDDGDRDRQLPADERASDGRGRPLARERAGAAAAWPLRRRSPERGPFDGFDAQVIDADRRRQVVDVRRTGRTHRLGGEGRQRSRRRPVRDRRRRRHRLSGADDRAAARGAAGCTLVGGDRPRVAQLAHPHVVRLVGGGRDRHGDRPVDRRACDGIVAPPHRGCRARRVDRAPRCTGRRAGPRRGRASRHRLRSHAGGVGALAGRSAAPRSGCRPRAAHATHQPSHQPRHVAPVSRPRALRSRRDRRRPTRRDRGADERSSTRSWRWRRATSTASRPSRST